MEFGLNEILLIINEVKNTELSLFEYQDSDTKIKIRGAKDRRGKMTKRAGQAGANGTTGQSGLGMEWQAGANGTTGQSGLGTEWQAGVNGMLGQTGAVHGNLIGLSAAEADANHAPSVETSAQETTGALIVSPMVGTFYTAPSEDGEPFVHVGDTVKKGQVVGIVEAMKLMNEIESEYDGVVEEILVENEQMVEFGQPLLRVREEQGC